MTLVDTTAPNQIETIAFELDLPHQPQKVWRALTQPELLSEWLLPAIGFRLDPGATFTFKTQPVHGWDGVVNCQVVDVEPQRKLSYNWGVPGLNTVLTFTLTPSVSGTHLTIVQSGFTRDQKRESGGARYGWKMMGQRLIDLLARIS